MCAQAGGGGESVALMAAAKASAGGGGIWLKQAKCCNRRKAMAKAWRFWRQWRNNSNGVRINGGHQLAIGSWRKLMGRK